MRTLVAVTLSALMLLALPVAAVLVAAVPAAANPTIPSGQRTLGQSVLEPVYNDENAGQIVAWLLAASGATRVIGGS